MHRYSVREGDGGVEVVYMTRVKTTSAPACVMISKVFPKNIKLRGNRRRQSDRDKRRQMLQVRGEKGEREPTEWFCTFLK